MHLNQSTFLELTKTLMTCARKSSRKLQTATILYHIKKQTIVAIANNEIEDSTISCLKKYPWYKSLWGKNLILICTHAPSPESIRLFRRKRIQHVYFLENLNSVKSLRMMKHIKIPSTRLFITK